MLYTMRTILLVAAVLFAAIQTGFCQENPSDKAPLRNESFKKFQWGLQTGAGIAHINARKLSSFKDNVEPLLSFSGNIYLAYHPTRHFSISAEPGFIRKGSTYKITALDPPQPARTVQWQLNYLDLPVLAHFYSRCKWSAYAGPAFCVLVNTNIPFDDSFLNKTDLSGLIGITYTLTPHFDIGLRYGHGLTSIGTITVTNENGIGIQDFKEYNQYGQLLLRYRI